MKTTEQTSLTATASSSSAKVRRSEAALKERGGCRIPNGMLQPDAAQALAELVTLGYAASPVAVIASAIMDAHKRMARRRGKSPDSQRPRSIP